VWSDIGHSVTETVFHCFLHTTLTHDSFRSGTNFLTFNLFAYYYAVSFFDQSLLGGNINVEEKSLNTSVVHDSY